MGIEYFMEHYLLSHYSSVLRKPFILMNCKVSSSQQRAERRWAKCGVKWSYCFLNYLRDTPIIVWDDFENLESFLDIGETSSVRLT